MPNPPRLLHSHLPDSANVKDPLSFFDLFLKDDDFNEIIMNTNKYAEDYTRKYQDTSQWRFNPINRSEIKVYFAILIYIGIHWL